MRAAMIIALALSLAACSSSDASSGGEPGAKGFHPDAVPSGASVTLHARASGANTLELELVGHGLSDVYGLAFRLKYDPSVLAYTGLDQGQVPGGAGVLSLGSAKTPGLLVGVLSQKGKHAGAAADGAVLGVVRFQILSAHSCPIEFVAGRNAVVAATGGEPVPGVAFVGGQLN